MSSYVGHAIEEFKYAGWINEKGEYEDDMQKLVCEQVLELLELFGAQGYSGSSAPYAISLFTKLAKFSPISPVTGKNEEWIKIAKNSFQNKRLSSIFKDGKDKAPYYLDAIIWRDKNGATWNGSCDGISSSQNIKLPFTPKTFYIDVRKVFISRAEAIEKEIENKCFEQSLDSDLLYYEEIVDKNQLKEAAEYYDVQDKVKEMIK